MQDIKLLRDYSANAWNNLASAFTRQVPDLVPLLPPTDVGPLDARRYMQRSLLRAEKLDPGAEMLAALQVRSGLRDPKHFTSRKFNGRVGRGMLASDDRYVGQWREGAIKGREGEEKEQKISQFLPLPVPCWPILQ
jgi:hypothetical protein